MRYKWNQEFIKISYLSATPAAETTFRPHSKSYISPLKAEKSLFSSLLDMSFTTHTIDNKTYLRYTKVLVSYIFICEVHYEHYRRFRKKRALRQFLR